MVYISKEYKFQIYVMKGSSSMKKMNNRKGFTLAELLIVVAIIAVLVAVAIPVFTAQLEKAREATDIANVRSAYAEVMTNYLTHKDGETVQAVTVEAKQTIASWQGPTGFIEYFSGNTTTASTYSAKTSGQSYTVSVTVDTSGNALPSVS